MPAVVLAYFSSEVDHLSQNEFDVLAENFSPHMTTIDTNLIVARLIKWFDSNKFERIRWLLEQQVKRIEAPSESLISLIKSEIQSIDSAKRDIAEKINVFFGLGVVLSELNLDAQSNAIN